MNTTLKAQRHWLTGLLVTASLFACTEKAAPPQQEVLRPVRTFQVTQGNAGLYKEFTAVVDASQKVDLAFKVAGRVEQLKVKAGDSIKKGELIAALDETDFRVALDEAQSNYEKAKADFERAKSLIKSRSISQSDFDQLKSQAGSALAQLENAQNRLAYSSLEATFDGIIAQRYIENYQEVNAKERIVALHDIQNINFEINVPESVLINVAPDAAPPKVIAYFESIPGEEFDLTFKEIDTKADDVSKTYKATFTMENSRTHTILPGMTARVRVLKDEQEVSLSRYLVPAQSVLKDKEGHYVFTVTATENGKGKISRKNVSIGEITAWGIEVYTGVTDGEHVVNAGMSKIRDGMMVKFNQGEAR